MRAVAAQWEVPPNPLELTMAPRALYQRLCQRLQACMPGLGVWPTRRLALVNYTDEHKITRRVGDERVLY